jgi:hypothetical protein
MYTRLVWTLDMSGLTTPPPTSADPMVLHPFGRVQVVIIDVSAGSMHSAAVAASGELYTWGCNKSGQLGYDGRGQVEGYPRIAHMLFHRSGKAPRKATQVRTQPLFHLIIIHLRKLVSSLNRPFSSPSLPNFFRCPPVRAVPS